MKNKRINILFESYKRKATHKDENKTNSIFGKNRNVKNILLDWSFNSSYFNSSCFYSYYIKIMFCNKNYQNKIAEWNGRWIYCRQYGYLHEKK